MNIKGAIIGPHNTDLVTEIALAIKLDASVKDLADPILLHSSLSEAVIKSAHAFSDECLHLPPKMNPDASN